MQKFPQRGNYKILKKKTELSEGESGVVGCNEPNKVKVRLKGAGETEKVLMNPSQADYPSTASRRHRTRAIQPSNDAGYFTLDRLPSGIVIFGFG